MSMNLSGKIKIHPTYASFMRCMNPSADISEEAQTEHKRQLSSLRKTGAIVFYGTKALHLYVEPDADKAALPGIIAKGLFILLPVCERGDPASYAAVATEAYLCVDSLIRAGRI